MNEGPDTVAAFIAEPVQGAGGVIVPPENRWYFTGLAILNPDDSTANATIEVYDAGGTKIAGGLEVIPCFC